jgi:thiol peroxidase
LGLSACGTLPGHGKSAFSYKDMPVADGSAVAGESNNILFQGKPLMLAGMGVKVGDKLRDVKLAQPDLSMIPINETKGKGKVRIISIVPSLDTKVCEQQTHYLSEKNMGLDRMVELITISVDTPFAQKRFAEEAKISNVTFLSDYRAADFGKAHGLLLKDLHLLSRAVLVVDKDNKVRYLQITPELAQLPDLEEAFRFARKLVTAS